MAAWVKEEEKASEHWHRKREAEEADKVEVAPGVTVASLRRFRAALIRPTQGLCKRRRLCRWRSLKPWEYGVVDAMRLGTWLRSGEGIGWPATGTIPNSFYEFPSIFFWYMCFALLFLSFCRFVFVFMFSLERCRCSFLIFSCPADHVLLPDWQPRILLGLVEARLVNVKNTTIPGEQWCLVFSGLC